MEKRETLRAAEHWWQHTVRDWQRALLSFWHAVRRGPEANVLLVNAALNALGRPSRCQRPWQCAVELLQQSQNAGMQYNEVSIGAVCAATSKWFMSLAWLSCRFRNEQIVGQTADAMAKATLWQETLILHQWQDSEGSRSVVLSSCTAEACRSNGRWAMAIQVLLPVFESGPNRLAPDVVCCGQTLAACAAGGAWLEAQLFLGRCHSWRLRRDVAHYGALAQAAAQRGRCDVAKLMEELLQKDMQPTLTFQNILANAAGIAWEKALHVVTTFDAVTFNVLAKACAQDQQWQRAANDLNVMMQRNISPDVVSHSVMMTAFGYGKRWEMVLLQLSEEWKFDDLYSGSAIAACANADSWSSALWMLQASDLSRRKNDLALRTTASSAAAKGFSSWRLLVAMLAALRTDGLQATPGTIEAVSSLLARGKLWQVALQQEEVDFAAMPVTEIESPMMEAATKEAMRKLKQGWIGATAFSAEENLHRDH